MFEKTEGTAQKVAGRLQNAFGSATGDSRHQVEGKVREAAGEIQQRYGDALNQVRESAVANPLGTVAVVAGVAFVLGALWSKR